MHRSLVFAVALLVASMSSVAQSSHQVNPDRTITFRLTAPAATKVEVVCEALPKPLPMTRTGDGPWTVTTPPVTPEIYGYSFRVDGRVIVDPTNPDVKPSLLGLSTNVLVPGTPPEPWELTAIPHGDLDHHLYTTHVAKNLPGGQEAYVVYTPPGYDAHRKGGYPVLYLLHGWSDDERGWPAVGHANLILDSLIGAGKAVPMILVMPLGYGDYDFVTHGFTATWNTPAKVEANTALFWQMLETEIMPAVEHTYNVASGRENRAIAGLSMGGLESLYALNHTDQFAYIVGLSSAVQYEPLSTHTPQLNAKKANLRLLWVACGTSDGFMKANREFVTWAKAQGLPVTAVETPGVHSWLVWRDNLINFAPLLFRK